MPQTRAVTPDPRFLMPPEGVPHRPPWIELVRTQSGWRLRSKGAFGAWSIVLLPGLGVLLGAVIGFLASLVLDAIWALVVGAGAAAWIVFCMLVGNYLNVWRWRNAPDLLAIDTSSGVVRIPHTDRSVPVADIHALRVIGGTAPDLHPGKKVIASFYEVVVCYTWEGREEQTVVILCQYGRRKLTRIAERVADQLSVPCEITRLRKDEMPEFGVVSSYLLARCTHVFRSL